MTPLSTLYREWLVYLQQPLLPTFKAKQCPRGHYPTSAKSSNVRQLLQHLTLFRALSAVALFVALWGYLQLLVRYGSISPLATALFTTSYDGRLATDFPPFTKTTGVLSGDSTDTTVLAEDAKLRLVKDGEEGFSTSWRPPFRVVVSLTTTPNRLDKVMDSVRSLTRQSLVPDQIYVNVPDGPMKRHPERSYDDVAMPEALSALSPLVRVNRCVDDGPATKLLGALRLEDDPTTLIITVDDDFEYPARLVESLAWEAVAKPDDVLGVCGWGMLPLYHSVGVVPAYVPYFMRPRGRYVDILQACCGNAYRRGFFSDVEAFADIPSVCVTVDDVWIAGYLRTVENRASAIISKRLDPIDPQWKKDESSSAERRSMTLSSYNHEHRVHYKCVEAIEDKFQRRWRRNFE